MIKAIEYLTQARETMLEHMLRADHNAAQISSFQLRFEQDVKHIKEESVSAFIELHPEIFQHRIEFRDWESAMQFLNQNSAAVLSFWRPLDR